MSDAKPFPPNREDHNPDNLPWGDSRSPVFGEWMMGIWAGLNNPNRKGMYVETKRRSGRLNPGTWYRLTDGKGRFWEYEAKHTVYLGGQR